jgi:DNA-binding response OmpR family regulator
VSPHHLLFVDTDEVTRRCAQGDIAGFRTLMTATVEYATRVLHQVPVVGMVINAQLEDGSGIDLCRSTKARTEMTRVLITTNDPEQAPDAIDAGCDGVLLKPFSPNLLFARMGRLLRAQPDGAKEAGPTSNQYWPRDVCPHCDHVGVSAFEFCDHRRAWYACLSCRRVWIARRHDERLAARAPAQSRVRAGAAASTARTA